MDKIKVVVLLPEDYEDIYEFFPSFIYLKELYEDLELNIVSDQNCRSELSHLPFKVRHYSVEKKDLSAIGSLKLAHKLTDLFNITHFYNYRTGIGALNFARSLKAHETIGFSDPVGNLLYCRSVEEDKAKCPSMRYLDLVKEESKAPSLRVNYIETEKLPENFFKSDSHDPFVFIALGNLEADEYRFGLVRDCLRQLGNQKIILWSPSKNLHHQDILESCPNIIDATEVNYTQIHQYIINAKGVLTDLLGIARLTCFIGVDHFLIDRNDHRAHGIPAFHFVLSQLNFDENEIRYIEGEEQLKEMKEASELGDLFHEKFNL